jgi:hypothetical protein
MQHARVGGAFVEEWLRPTTDFFTFRTGTNLGLRVRQIFYNQEGRYPDGSFRDHMRITFIMAQEMTTVGGLAEAGVGADRADGRSLEWGERGMRVYTSGVMVASGIVLYRYPVRNFDGRNRPTPRPQTQRPGNTGRPMTADQRAFKELVDEATKGGRIPLSRDQAEWVLDMAEEIGYPRVRAGLGDLANPSNWTANPTPHIHIPGAGRSGHIPVEPGVIPRP